MIFLFFPKQGVFCMKSAGFCLRFGHDTGRFPFYDSEKTSVAFFYFFVYQCFRYFFPFFCLQIKKKVYFCSPNLRKTQFIETGKLERCRSGRSGRSRKPLTHLVGPRVRIPVSPLHTREADNFTLSASLSFTGIYNLITLIFSCFCAI